MLYRGCRTVKDIYITFLFFSRDDSYKKVYDFTCSHLHHSDIDFLRLYVALREIFRGQQRTQYSRLQLQKGWGTSRYYPFRQGYDSSWQRRGSYIWAGRKALYLVLHAEPRIFCRSTLTLIFTANSLLLRGSKSLTKARKLLRIIRWTKTTKTIIMKKVIPFLCLNLLKAKATRAIIFTC